MNNRIYIFRTIIGVIFASLTHHGFCQTERYSIVISEIMADPSPTVGLPNAEYIELHNRSGDDCLLIGYQLQIGNTIKALPVISIDSGGYILLTAEKSRALFENLGIEVYTLSSLSITDAGQSILLLDANGQVIHGVAFRKSWHEEVIKQDGGWSLELVDVDRPCRGAPGWASSEDPTGGTPGRANSPHAAPADEGAPIILRATMTDSASLRLYFSETIWNTTGIQPDDFRIVPELPIQHVAEVPPFFESLDLQLTGEPFSETTYRVSIIGDLAGCSGNMVASGEGILWGKAQAPLPGDLVINEVLSHPFDGSDADYIEIYNPSEKIVDLRDIMIGSGGDTMPRKAVVAASGGMQLLPGHFAVLCKNRRLTMLQYAHHDPAVLHQCDSLPAYANASGVVFLTTRGMQIIDRLAYDERMHYSHLSSTEGVSLERLSADQPTQDASNWHSAAESAGFGTPGLENSQHGRDAPEAEVAVMPDVISPDNDGFEDFAEFFIQFPLPEQRLTIRIFDERGTMVCHLVNNDLCGTEARYRWEGLDDSGQPVPTGLYIADIRWWGDNGRGKHTRKVVGVRQ